MEPIQQINNQFDVAKHTRWIVYTFIGLFIVAGVIFLYNRFWPKAVIEELSSHVAAELPKAANIKKHTITAPKTIEVYDRSDLLKKVPVAAEVAQNQSNQFTATAVIPPMRYGGQAVSFTNMSGKSGMAVQANKRPLFGFGGKTGIGVVAGVSTKGNIAAIYTSQDIIRIGPVNLGVAAGGGTIGSDAVGAGVIHIHSEF